MTKSEAYDAMLQHHALLCKQVAQRSAAVGDAVEHGREYGTAVAAFVAHIAAEVLPHAMAEEHTIYAAAANHPGLGDVIEEMVGEHRRLTDLAEQIATEQSGPAAAASARAFAELFDRHVAKENGVILPALGEDPDVDLAQLLVQMHRLAEAVQQGGSTREDLAMPDSEDALVALFLEAASDLARAGHADRACSLAASAWKALRVPRPDLAVRVTAAMHRLASMTTREVVTFSGSRDRRGPEDRDGSDPELDVRTLAPAQRHEKIFATYEHLEPGAGFVLVNDHDPKPLYYQFEAEHSGQFTWDYLEAGPRTWRVRIGRVPLGAPG